MKFMNYIRITPRTVTVILILLMLIDIGVRWHWDRYYREPGQARLANQELATLRVLRNEIRSARGYKILFLGDSAVYGSAVKDPAQTIPAYLEQELNRLWPARQVKVFNFSFKGYGMSENYFILNALADAGIDLVIYNVSTGWFNREKTLEHSNVVFLSDDYFGRSKVIKTGVNVDRSDKEILEDKIDQAVGRIWKLYQTRSGLTTLLLGKPLRGMLTDWQLALTNPAELARREKEEADLYRPWYKKDWAETLGKERYKIGTVNLSPQNPQVTYYNLMLDLLAAKQIKGLFYASPQNIKMLEQYDKLDRKAWKLSLDRLRAMTETKGVTYVDYTNLVPDRFFTDSIHLDHRGNRIVAEQLFQDISAGLDGKPGQPEVKVE